jgi:hypothetical protein
VLVSLTGSSFLSEVDDTSILRTGLSIAPSLLQASRLTPPRSGPEHSDFVHWPKASVTERPGARKVSEGKLTSKAIERG